MKQFTLEFYKQLVAKADKTLRIVDWTIDCPQMGLILRHDVDLSLSLAYEFSKTELEIDVLSTYYVLTTTDLYNPFSRINRVLLREMDNAGFEIGLHFDPRICSSHLESDLRKALVRERDQLENILGKPVVSYSFHNPSMWGEINLSKIEDLVDAYDPEIFGDDRYISDSLFSFREKDPEEWVRKSNVQLIQFLTHPFQYFGGQNE